MGRWRTCPPGQAPGAAAVPIDGRRARRERGRAAVVDALFKLGRHPARRRGDRRAGWSRCRRCSDTSNRLDDLREHTIEHCFERLRPSSRFPSLKRVRSASGSPGWSRPGSTCTTPSPPWPTSPGCGRSKCPSARDGETRAGSAAQIHTRFAEELAEADPDRGRRLQRHRRLAHLDRVVGTRAKPTSGHDNRSDGPGRARHYRPAECVANMARARPISTRRPSSLFVLQSTANLSRLTRGSPSAVSVENRRGRVEAIPLRKASF